MSSAEQIFICLATPLCVSLLFAKDGARRFCVFLIVGIVMCLLVAYMNSFLITMTGSSVGDAAIYLTPITEELMKFLPLVFYLLVLEPDDDALMTAALAVGVGFATFENCCYVASAVGITIGSVLIRGFAVGVMHVVCTLAAGLVLVMARKVGGLTWLSVVGVMALVVTYHATYNLLVSVPGASRIVGYVLPVLSLACILLWRWARKRFFKRSS